MRRRVVIDNNVYVSSYLRPMSLPGRAVDRAAEFDLLLMSKAAFLELRTVISRAKFARYVDPSGIEPFLEYIQITAEPVIPHTQIRACRDPRDNKFLELAVDGKAELILTGDQDLLILNPFQGIAILTPAEYLEREPTQPTQRQ